VIKMGAKNLLSHSFRIAWKDLMELFRNKMMLVMLILMPLFMMVMVGFIYSPSAGSMSIALVNEDAGFNSTFQSQNFIMSLTQISNMSQTLSNKIDLTVASNFDEVKNRVQSGEIDGGIIIPSNFSTSIMNGQQGTLILVLDQSNPQMSAAMNVSLTTLCNGIGTLFAQQQVTQLNPSINENNSLAIVQPYNVKSENIVPGNPTYFDFIAPGIIAMTVMMSVMTGLPAAISQEKEIGTLDGMMTAPINRLSVILGKTLAQTARGLLQGAIILVLAVGLFGVTIQGNILLVFGLLLLGVFSFVGLGVVLTSFAKDQETATMMMTTIMFPMMFLGGVFFPIQQMPWFMQGISQFLPLTYISDALRKVMVLGADIPAISTDLTILIVFGVVMIAIAVPVFKKMMTR